MAALVLNLFRDISFFKSEIIDNIKLHVQAFFINATQEFWFSYRRDHNAIVF